MKLILTLILILIIIKLFFDNKKECFNQEINYETEYQVALVKNELAKSALTNAEAVATSSAAVAKAAAAASTAVSAVSKVAQNKADAENNNEENVVSSEVVAKAATTAATATAAIAEFAKKSAATDKEGIEKKIKEKEEAEAKVVAAKTAADNNRTTKPPITTKVSMLYEFKEHKFTTANKTGPQGPTLQEVKQAYSSVSWAQNSEFLNMTTQGIQEWKVPVTGNYKIRAAGAKGGDSVDNLKGGKGIDLTITTTLNKGEIIKILVGQSGISANANKSSDGTGGGGGTFVVRDIKTPIIVAGGGGGASSNIVLWNYSGDKNGGNGTNTTNGGGGGRGSHSNFIAKAGIDGNGATTSNETIGNGNGSPGGGLLSNGVFYNTSQPVGIGFINGGLGGGNTGGFGGGAGGYQDYRFTGGGGGGYSGGAGAIYDGNSNGFPLYTAGGGGSYSITGKFDTQEFNNSDGFVTITLVDTNDTKSSAFSKLFTESMTYNIPKSVNKLKIFMIGGGASGYGSHGGGGGAGYITTSEILQIKEGTVITVSIGVGGVRTSTGNEAQTFDGKPTTVTIKDNTYTAKGGLASIRWPSQNCFNGGFGSSGGGGAGNSGSGGNGGSGGSNESDGAAYKGGEGMGTSAFNNTINFIGKSPFNFRAGAGGATGVSSHSGGGGAGGIICDTVNYPTAENGGDTTSGKGGVGFGAGGGSGGYNVNTYYYGGAGASGMVYIFEEETDINTQPPKDFTNIIPSKGMGRSMYICCSNDGKYVYQATLGQIHGSDDYGKNFKAFTTEDTEWSHINCDPSGAIIAATTWGGKLQTSFDYGKNWTNNTAVMSNLSGAYISPNKQFLYYYAPVGFIVKMSGNQYTSGGQILNTNNWGQFWPRCKMASSEDGNILYITGGGQGKKCYMSKNGGSNWQEINLEAGVYQGVACSSDGSIVYIAGGNGRLYHSTDTGATWNNIQNGNMWYDVCCSSDGKKVFICGDNLRYSFDSGKSWKELKYGGQNLMSICCSKDGTKVYFALGQGGIFYLE